MNGLRKLLLIASTLALLVRVPVEAQRPDTKSKRVDTRELQQGKHVDNEQEQAVEHKEDNHLQNHNDKDEHKEGVETHAQEQEDDAGHKDEHDTISALVNLDEPPSSDTSEAKQENGDHHPNKLNDHKSADHEEVKHEETDRGKAACCWMSLRKPFSASSRCSCTHWLKDALRHSVFVRPILEFVRKSVHALSHKGHLQSEEGAEKFNDTEEQENEEQIDSRHLQYVDIGYRGGGYYGGYPLYGVGYPAVYGYPAMGFGGVSGVGLGVSF